MYITGSSSISFQKSFRNKGFSRRLSELSADSELIHPDYTDFIPKMQRRRMSNVLKMSVTCSAETLKVSGVEQPDGIIVGTAMGCPSFTKKFMDKIIASENAGSALSPTSFIVSTHNTIAGQISLMLRNHGYNMTHTQGTLSFEQALIDGILCLEDGKKNVMIGAADEQEDELFNTKERLSTKNIILASGASFFMVSQAQKSKTDVRLKDVSSMSFIQNPEAPITDFLKANNLSAEAIDLILYSSSDSGTLKALTEIFDAQKNIDFQKISGWYFTNPGFAMDYGIDILRLKKYPEYPDEINRILICNNLMPEHLGLILLENSSSSL